MSGKTAALALGAFIALGATAAWSTPIESLVEALGPKGPLKGTMLSPAAKAPLAIIIPGSGPTDRNGNNPLGVKAAPYRLLAEGLAAEGIATVRIDKRGMFASNAAGDPNAVTFGTYSTDIHSWARTLRSQTGEPCVWLIGHSEGAATALASAQDPTDICGLVLISGVGRPTADVLHAQLAANPGAETFLPAMDKVMAELAAGRTPDLSTLPPQLAANLFGPQVQGFVADMLRQKPAELVRGYQGPILVLQGDADLQVTVQDADILADARPGVTKVLLPGVNHVLKTAPRERAANLATYVDPSLPLAPGIADAVADFIKAH